VKRLEFSEIRVLKTGYNTAYWNMALDEVLMKSVRRAMSGTPVLRLYGWNPPAISIGYFQSVEQEVNVQRCNQIGIDIVRRVTGGGAVLHEYEVTYSFITRKYPQNILESYKMVCDPIVNGLINLGFHKTRFAPLNDIVVDGKKVSGNAQTRKDGVLLQHGTILLNVNFKKMFTLLKIPKEKIGDKMIDNVSQRVMSLNRTFEEVSTAIAVAFRTKFAAKLIFDKITPQEVRDSKVLIREKYATAAWNWRR
jgi:lipoate---protein ligase